ncbi:Lig NAD-dependent DNA ligase (contains BRCT domain type II) [uncultured Caudovirales phage]|uniref:DNA ligase (NAD(+)) n=1 Tax=uncultured Caudovirales phage TaxID=2100421 RepID=A0A6J5LJD8_9CAUD|nr:Lig NAD-dependent DNA ligase (contains BRCT domain type II) [uncultured Caudovirales phage]
MNKVEEFLNRAARHYYAGTPIISDEQFDALADTIGYNKVGSKQHENVHKHYREMWSLKKYYEDEGRSNPLAAFSDITRSPKLDGAAVSHLYIDGVHVLSLTRGDGIKGRDVTDKFASTNLIPHEIPELGVVQITGEVAAPKHVENARNYAAGALNLGEVSEFKTRSVEFFAYGVYPYLTDTFDGDMRKLRKYGFNTVQDDALVNIFPTDGVVFRVNNNKLFDSLGYTANHPHGAYALKVRSECVETTLLDVVWQVGKSGKVTPVAILEPVMVGDAQVSRATLNNPGFIEALDLAIGDRVAIRRSGEIIPQIVYKVE